jgi:hypothetical protein
MLTLHRSLLSRFALSALASAMALVALPTSPAQASSSVTGVRVVAVDHTSFTVRLDSQGSGWKYRLYASTNKPDVYYGSMQSAPYQSALRSKPRLTLSNLPYRTKQYWWRVQAVNNGHVRTAPIMSIGLKPTAPTGLVAPTGDSNGLYLKWNGGASFGFQVQQSTDPTFATGVTSYKARGLGKQFTPYSLPFGATLSFRVRSSNFGTNSGWSNTVTATVAAHTQHVRVGDFNVHENTTSDNKLPPWKDRRDAVIGSINSGDAQVLAIVEAAQSIDGTKCGKRMVDDLVDHLGGNWALADTEIKPCGGSGWVRVGDYVIYDNSAYKAVGASGHWLISSPSESKRWWAAYQVLENRATGGRFLFVSTHLIVGNKLALDKDRADETKRLLNDVNGLNLGLPVVYAGDFNSHDQHQLDGPGDVMRNANNADAWYVSQHRVHAAYNSANDYQRRPPKFGVSIDHVYGSPGVGLQTWNLVMKLKDGEFVGVIPSDHSLLVSDVSYPY